MSCRELSGVWRSGPNAGSRGVTSDVRAGSLITTDAHGGLLYGDATDFITSNGLTGVELLSVLVPSPTMSALLHGALRETIAHSYGVLSFGHQETRTFDSPEIYLSYTSDGDFGAILFGNDLCVGLAHNHEVDRPLELDELNSMVTPDHSRAFRSLFDLPLIASLPPITCAFWNSGDNIVSLEPWHSAYRYGAEQFHHETLDNESWILVAAEHYDMTESVAQFITALVDDNSRPVVISRHDCSILFPLDHPSRDDAIKTLMSGGAFIIQ